MTEPRRQVFFITGGSRGIGARLVLDAAAAGHDVAFTYRTRSDAADTVLAEVSALGLGARCRAYQLDVRDAQQVERVADQVVSDFETVDVVVNNAAMNKNGLLFSTADDDWHDVLQTNLTGAFYVTRQFLPVLLANRGGRFIHISSIAAKGMSGQAAYAASKAGLLGLSATIAKEYGKKAVTSNALILGFFDTDLTREQMSDRNRVFWSEFAPTGRMGRVGEVSAAALFLASDGAGFVNGQVLSVTGGLDWAP